VDSSTAHSLAARESFLQQSFSRTPGAALQPIFDLLNCDDMRHRRWCNLDA
jgi:hypothetical protein